MTTSVASRFLAVDPHMKNAYSPTAKFDISHIKPGNVLRFKPKKGGNAFHEEEEEEDNGEITIKKQAAKEWELDVRSLISSKRWLQNYGLRKNRLQLNQILPSIGFKLSDEFDETLKKPISSRYGGGLFRQLLHPDGRTFNVSCGKDKLMQLEKRLLQAMYLFRRRLEWLTTESRRVFGVLEERSATIVLDIRNMSPQQFDQYRTALERVLREQVSQLAKFNLIRASEDIQLYSPECAPVSHDTIETAVQWVWNLDRLAPVSNTAAAEAVVTALRDQHNEAVYLFTEGTSIDSGKEILKDKVANARSRIPIHAVSFNCDCSNTVKFLKEFSKSTGGRFHAYAVVMELDAYEAKQDEGPTNKANIMLKRKTFGGIPPGTGCRDDVVLIFEEMEEARNNLAQVRMLIENAPEPKGASKGNDSDPSLALRIRDEQYMSSREWLDIYGLSARKLGLYDILSGVAFKHQDGVIDVMHAPPTDSHTDAIKNQKLINARYCERFPIVRWKDGRVVHVQVTPEVHRMYEERVQVALTKIQQRIDWLNQGSRALFGTLVEESMYILIDTSASMQPSLGFVKQKLFVLMQEQLRHKRKFNIVSFNSKAIGWKDRLVEVSERSLQSAWTWVQNLSCWGSTNTYAAIQMAMADPQTQAIYLLSDGRPDQPPKSIIAQVQMQKHIPIHTISFNCNDKEANQFLYELAEATGGRYHYYSEAGPPVDQPKAWESMDVKLLKDELKRGVENLDTLANLRDECTSLAWKKETDSLRQSLNSARSVKDSSRSSPMPPIDYTDSKSPIPSPSPRPENPTPSHRPASAPPPKSPVFSLDSPRHTPTPPPERPGSAHGERLRGSGGLPKRLPRRPKSAKISVSRKPLVAGHTRTSLMRTLNSSGRFSPNEWLLPETKSLFQLQAERQKDMAQQREKKEKIIKKNKKKLLKANEMSSKQWLAKNGLVAKRLTILDALGSTFVPHKSKYISILDKHVMSKVFDEVMPIAHVSKNQQVRLVNPNGVNLREYESKVEASLEKYRKRLNNLVWNALSGDAKEEFDSDKPVPFDENRNKILLRLEEADWPVKEQDVLLLADEIARGEKFLRQSLALRKAAQGEDLDEDDQDNLTLEDSPRSPRASRSDKNDDASPPRSNRSEDNSQRPSRSDGSPQRSEQESRDYEGLGQVIRSKEKSVQGKVKESSEVIKSKVRVRLDTLKGQRVIARKDRDGLYYPAVVLKCSDPRHANVQFEGEDAETAIVLTRNVIPVGGAVARPPLSIGDYILVRVVYLDTKDECYVPAIIHAEPQNAAASQKFYSVIMYNGQKATTMRKFLVKISKERFELASMYIAEQQNEDRKEVEDIVYVTPRKSSDEDRRARKRPDDRKKHLRKVSPESVSSDIGSEEETRNRERRRRPRAASKSSSGERSISDEDRDKETRRRSKSPRDRSRSRSNSSRSTSRSPERSQPIRRGRSRSGSSRSNSDDDFFGDEKEKEDRDDSREKSERGRKSPRLSDMEQDDQNAATPRNSREGSPRSGDGRDKGGSQELEKLQRELLEQQKRQERRKRKLKRRAKLLAKQRKEIKESILKELAPDELPEEQDAAQEEENVNNPTILELRKSLMHLRPGEEVLARWSDDGWYYRGIVRQYHGDHSYNMEDSTGYVERIWRENIISENDNPDKMFELGHKVIALHPDYSFSYAPGTVTGISDSEVEVLFFDNATAVLPWNEVYHSCEEKHRADENYIRQREDALVDAAVVARDDRTGAYYPGTVTAKLAGENRLYSLEWAGGSSCRQEAVHIFSAFTRRPNLSVGDRVLACADPIHVKFLPGFLVGALEDRLIVKFCNTETRDDIDPSLCYWLGQNYYNSAVKFYRQHDPSYSRF